MRIPLLTAALCLLACSARCVYAAPGTAFPASLLDFQSVRAAGLAGVGTALGNSQDPMSAAQNPAAPSVTRLRRTSGVLPSVSRICA